MYSDNDIFLLDDPLSAVDAHVGERIFSKCIKEYLHNKTRILVTHHVTVLPHCDHIIVLDQTGHITAAGTFADISRTGIDIEELVASEPALGAVDLVDEPQPPLPSPNSRGKTTTSEPGSIGGDKSARAGDSGNIVEKEVHTKEDLTAATTSCKSDLMTKEEKNEGAVKLQTYLSYIAVGGFFAFFFVVTGQLAAQGIGVYANFYLIDWGEDTTDSEFAGKEMSKHESLGYLHVYAAMLMASVFGGLVSRMALVAHRTKASEVLHDQLLRRVLYFPVSFFGKRYICVPTHTTRSCTICTSDRNISSTCQTLHQLDA